MNDHDGKEWVLTQIKRKYSKGKTKPEGCTLSELLSYALKERKRICDNEGIKTSTKFGKKLQGTAGIQRLPPGEDRVRRYTRDLEKDGRIKFYERPSKKGKRSKKKKKNDHGGGRGNRRVMVPIEYGKNLGGRKIHPLLRLRKELGRFREMDVGKIGVNELSNYVMLKNRIFRFPVEYAHTIKISRMQDRIFEYVYKDIAGICDEIEKEISGNGPVRDAQKALERLASSDEFLRKGTLRFEPGLDDLAISRSVIVVKDLNSKFGNKAQ